MYILPLIYGLFGLVIGSFLNVCIYRIPLGKSIVFPASSCTHCGVRIRPYDNVPVLSYLLLGGKCRACGQSISPQYPLVELLSGLAFFSCGLKWNFASPTFVNSLLLSIVIVLIFIDYHHRILPNALTIPGTVAGILLSPLQSSAAYEDVLSIKAASLFGSGDISSILPWVGSISGALIWSGVLLMVGLAYEKVRKRQGLGMGDVKMMAMIGAFLGSRLAFLTMFAGSLLGLLVAVYLIVFRHMNLQTKLPFGVFLGLGSALSLFYGLPFLHWYLNIAR